MVFPSSLADGALEGVSVLLVSCCAGKGVGVVVVVVDLGVVVADAVGVGCTVVADPGSNQRELKTCTYTHSQRFCRTTSGYQHCKEQIYWSRNKLKILN